MSATNNNFLDLNAGRGYPLDDLATAISDEGVRMPDGIIVDACLRYPIALGEHPYISAVHVSPKLVSVVVSVAAHPGIAQLQPVATLALSSVAEGRVYPLTGLMPGVAGWVIFGSLRTVRYTGRFSKASQSRLLPKVARGYEALPVPWVSKLMDENKLVDTVRLYPGLNIEIVREPRLILDELRDAIVIRLTGNLNDVLPNFVGPCGKRPESNNCSKPALEGINEVDPDEDGNIVINFPDMTVTNIPNGLLLSTSLALPELCPDTVNDNQPDSDQCLASESMISEISDSVSDSESASESESTSDSESSEVLEPNYPACIRFFDDVVPPFDLVQGSWVDMDGVPSGIICSPDGHGSDDFRMKRFTGGTANIAIHNDPAYDQTIGLRFETLISPGGKMGGLALDYRLVGGLRQYHVLVVNVDTQRLELRRFNGVYLSPAIVSVAGVVINPTEWYKVTCWVSQTEGAPAGRVDLRCFIQRSGYFGTGTSGWVQLTNYNGFTYNAGRNGIYGAPDARVAYYRVDEL